MKRLTFKDIKRIKKEGVDAPVTITKNNGKEYNGMFVIREDDVYLLSNIKVLDGSVCKNRGDFKYSFILESGDCIRDLYVNIKSISMSPQTTIIPPLSYQERQDQWVKDNDIKIGDTVTVLRKAKSQEDDWDNSWVKEMNESVGNKFEILCINSDIGLNTSSIHYGFPFFVLEPVKKVKPKTKTKSKKDISKISLANIVVRVIDQQELSEVHKYHFVDDYEPNYAFKHTKYAYLYLESPCSWDENKKDINKNYTIISFDQWKTDIRDKKVDSKLETVQEKYDRGVLVVGEKYVPHRKTLGKSLKQCTEWNYARKTPQPYLFYRCTDENGPIFNRDNTGEQGSYYDISDVTPYVENTVIKDSHVVKSSSVEGEHYTGLEQVIHLTEQLSPEDKLTLIKTLLK